MNNDDEDKYNKVKPDIFENLSKKQTIVGCLTCTISLICLIVIVVCITVIPAGHVGVIDVFGNVQDDVLQPGIHFVLWPVIRLSTKTQIISMSEDVPSAEGMTIHLEAAALFHLNPASAAEMYKHVGTDYLDKVVIPQFRSVLRSVTSGHDTKDLYTSETRLIMTSSLSSDLTDSLLPRGLVVENTLLKKIVLPDRLQNAIQRKLEAEQASQQMEFVLQKEKQEAERKSIEAQGIQDFQNIVRQGIDDNLLRWKGIEATERLADSTNSKVVIIGGGTEGGLPIILNPADK